MNHSTRTQHGRFFIALSLICLAISASHADQTPYPEKILQTPPIGYWPLQGEAPFATRNMGDPAFAEALVALPHGNLTFNQPGQPAENYPVFTKDETAVLFERNQGYLRVADPGEQSPLDFDLGDTITLEAWVSLQEIKNGQNVYVIGKGRTGLPGLAAHNQNYAMRLRGDGGEAKVSFLFRNARNRPSRDPDSEKDWHRWTAQNGFLPGSGWHHVAVTYTFGDGESLRGYLDGRESKGRWDMGGRTDDGPVVDNDELWIGSSMGGNAASSLHGLMNEIAIHRRALTSDELQHRYEFIPTAPRIAATDLPQDAVRVELFEDVPGLTSWNFQVEDSTEAYTEPAMAFADLPMKYNRSGVRADRSQPFLLRAAAVQTLPAGQHRILLRALQSARLSVDGKVVAQTPFIKPGGDGHGKVPASPDILSPGLRFLRAGHHDALVTIESQGQPQVFVLEAIIGGKSLRPDVGELSVSVANAEDRFHLLSPNSSSPSTPLSDAGWLTYVAEQQERLTRYNAQRRQEAAMAENVYWQQRHEQARALVADSPAPTLPEVQHADFKRHPIDQFIGARLEAASAEPAPLTQDLAFLRRLSLDTRGVIPTPQEIQEFINDPSADRREHAIDRYLQDPRWADNWVGYWQDVLAENPGILKPTLNNTGPFRYWIHESFLDNKSMDRFATELIRMEGSVYFGGPAGFRLATQNDVPMADRAQIISQGFLAMNLTCARCHDAPYHEFKQKDLFSLAAMLKMEPQEVPASSSIPQDTNIKVGRLINVTLKPGEKVDPQWPFDSVMHHELTAASIREIHDSRDQLAALITDPRNERFPQVMVNRLWKRYLGWGLVEPVDDWETAQPSHPQLLAWLARQFVMHGYDLKHIARLIFTSHTYQREAGWQVPPSDEPEDRLFSSPARRRMLAEQIVDSLFQAVGKDMGCELVTLDNDSRRPANSFLNFGHPQHAWQFTSLSNDRDRPALSLPRTQEIVDVLAMFGWRESRQSARSARDHEPNVLQPAALANGRLGNGRIARLTDRCDLTELCLQPQSLPELLTQVSHRILSRPLTGPELATFSNYLAPGFNDRVNPSPSQDANQDREYDRSLLLSWSNHLNSEATEIMMAKEARESLGDPPTQRLQPEWRERMEDIIWAMINTPEFVFVP